MEYIKKNYGSQYLTALIVSKNYDNLIKILPYLQEKGWLDVVKTSASILSLTFEEIQERQAFIESRGEDIIIENKKGVKKFNAIFGWSRKKYQERQVKESDIKKTKTANSLIRAVAGKETPKLADEATNFMDLINPEKTIKEEEYKNNNE